MTDEDGPRCYVLMHYYTAGSPLGYDGSLPIGVWQSAERAHATCKTMNRGAAWGEWYVVVKCPVLYRGIEWRGNDA